MLGISPMAMLAFGNVHSVSMSLHELVHACLTSRKLRALCSVDFPLPHEFGSYSWYSRHMHVNDVASQHTLGLDCHCQVSAAWVSAL